MKAFWYYFRNVLRYMLKAWKEHYCQFSNRNCEHAWVTTHPKDRGRSRIYARCKLCTATR